MMFNSRARRVEQEIIGLRYEIAKIKEGLEIPILRDGEKCDGDLVYSEVTPGIWKHTRTATRANPVDVLNALLKHLDLKIEEIPKQARSFKLSKHPKISGTK